LRQLLNQAKQTLDLDNKGQIADLPATVTAFVVIVFVLGIGAVMVTALRDTDTVEENGSAYNIIEQGLEALDTFGSFLGILALAVIAGIIIFVLMTRIMPAQRE